MRAITRLDFALIDTRVQAVKKSLNLERASTAFIHAMLDAIYPDKAVDNKEIITDGSDDHGIDAIYINEREGSCIVDLFSFKYRANIDTCNKNFEENELNKVFGYITDILNENRASIQTANEPVRQKSEDIWNIIARGVICKFRIFLCSNGLPLAEKGLRRLESFCGTYDYTSFEQIDFLGVVKLLTTPGRSTESGKLKVIDKQIFDRSDGDLKGVVANIEIGSFIDLITDHHTASIKRHIFDDNIRVYLGDDGGYNQDII